LTSLTSSATLTDVPALTIAGVRTALVLGGSELTNSHWPDSHEKPSLQVPQVLSQPSSPHCFPPQLGVHAPWHTCDALHVCALPQVPQVPPQPLLPQFLPAHCGTHAHC